MLTAHRVVAFLVIAVCAVSAAAALVAYRRRGAAGRVVSQLPALPQTALIAQVGLGLLLLADHRRAAGKLHYMYGSLAVLATLAPWLYAPADSRRRLAGWRGASPPARVHRG